MKDACVKLFSFSYVRIVGTYNTVNNSFHLVSVEAMFVTEFFNVDSETTLLGSFPF